MNEEIRVKAEDEVFCTSCGNIIKREAEICPKCGVRQKKGGGGNTGGEEEGKSWTTTLILCVFLGSLGVHHFYTGRIGVGIFFLLTSGGCLIGVLIDLIRILCGNFTDSEGRPLVR